MLSSPVVNWEHTRHVTLCHSLLVSNFFAFFSRVMGLDGGSKPLHGPSWREKKCHALSFLQPVPCLFTPAFSPSTVIAVDFTHTHSGIFCSSPLAFGLLLFPSYQHQHQHEPTQLELGGAAAAAAAANKQERRPPHRSLLATFVVVHVKKVWLRHCCTVTEAKNVQLGSVGSDSSGSGPDGESEREYHRLSSGHHGHWHLCCPLACLYPPDEDGTGVGNG